MFETVVWPIVQKAVISIGVIVIVFACAWILNEIVVKRLLAAAERTSWHWDEAFLKSARKALPIFSLFLGLFLSTSFWDLSVAFEKTIDTFLIGVLLVLGTGFFVSLSSHLFFFYGRNADNAKTATSLTRNIVNGLIIIAGGLVLLNHFGVAITPMLTALGVGGVAIALGLQETLTNVFAGVYISWAGQFGLGDYIKIDGGEEGRVDDIAWRETRIRTMYDNLIIVPNSMLAKSVIKNFDKPVREMGFAFDVGVDYRSDLNHVEEVTLEVAEEVLKSVEGGVASFKPKIRYKEFADSSINFTVVLRATDYMSHLHLRHEFIKRLHERYRKEGINIPYPIRTIVYQDKNAH